MKKLLAVLLCLALVIGSLTGCGKTSKDDSNANTTNNDATTDTTQDSGATAAPEQDPAAKAIADRKAGGELPTVVMAFMNWSGSPAGLDRIQKLISDYTAEKLGVNVELEILDFASYKQNMTLMLSSGEQVDIFNAISVGYANSINKGYCLDLEQDNLIQSYGAGILSTMDPAYVNACRVSGAFIRTSSAERYGDWSWRLCYWKRIFRCHWL